MAVATAAASSGSSGPVDNRLLFDERLIFPIQIQTRLDRDRTVYAELPFIDQRVHEIAHFSPGIRVQLECPFDAITRWAADPPPARNATRRARPLPCAGPGSAASRPGETLATHRMLRLATSSLPQLTTDANGTSAAARTNRTTDGAYDGTGQGGQFAGTAHACAEQYARARRPCESSSREYWTSRTSAACGNSPIGHSSSGMLVKFSPSQVRESLRRSPTASQSSQTHKAQGSRATRNNSAPLDALRAPDCVSIGALTNAALNIWKLTLSDAMLTPESSSTSAPGLPSAKTRNDSRRLSDTSRKLMNCPSYHSKTMTSESSRIRYGVIAFGSALAVVTSIDRGVVLSLSRGRIAADLHLNDAAMGLVFSAGRHGIDMNSS